jgi:hypothetical protein
VTAVAALVVSIFTLNSQNSANSSQQSADQLAASQIIRQQAQHVTFTLEDSPKDSFGLLSVQNTSLSPVFDIVFGSTVQYAIGTQSTVNSFPAWFSLGDLRACQTGSIDLGKLVDRLITSKQPPSIRRHPSDYGMIGVGNLTMYFSDRNAVTWKYPEDGPLQQRTPPPYRATIVTPTYKSSPACS